MLRNKISQWLPLETKKSESLFICNDVAFEVAYALLAPALEVIELSGTQHFLQDCICTKRRLTLRKHDYSNILKSFHQKEWKFSDKKKTDMFFMYLLKT